MGLEEILHAIVDIREDVKRLDATTPTARTQLRDARQALILAWDHLTDYQSDMAELDD